MSEDIRQQLALKGIPCALRVDPYSEELIDLYLPHEAWSHLLNRFGGNKMRVTIRGPHDYLNRMIMPPWIISEKLINWISSDGELDGAIEIADEVLSHAED